MALFCTNAVAGKIVFDNIRLNYRSNNPFELPVTGNAGYIPD